MADPNNPTEVIAPPTPPAANLKNTLDVHTYLTHVYKHNYLMWSRSGGYTSSTPQLKGLKASVPELNTLVGINTDFRVQQQLDQKADISSLGTMAFQNASSVLITGGQIDGVTTNLNTINTATITGASISASSFGAGTMTTSSFSAGTVTNSNIDVKLGSTAFLMEAGGVANVNTTSVGNVDAGEDDLIQYTLIANSLDADGSFLEIEAFGIFAANANNKRIRLYLGSTVLIDTTAIAANSGSWIINSRVIRVSSNSQKIITKIISDNTLIVDSANYVLGAEDLTTGLIIKCTGEATTTNDVVQEGLTVKMFNG